jgi:enediyne biosynthesis protein E4
MGRLGRRSRIWVAGGATVLGTAALASLAAWTEIRRNTDLADATAAVTTSTLDPLPLDAPELRFVDVSADAGIAAGAPAGRRSRLLPEDTGSGLAWGDVDGDGDPDLFVVGFGEPNRLFLNDDGRFTEAGAAAGVDDPGGEAMGASFADYDGDGDLDLHVTRRGSNRLFRNRGDGTFDEVAAAAGIDDPSWSTGAAWGDFDRDGHLDLYVGSYLAFDAGPGDSTGGPAGTGLWSEVPFTLNPNAFDPLPSRLFRNRGDGTFEEVAALSGVADPGGRTLAVTACDLDGDGWLDLYAANDVSPNALFRNLGAEGLPGLFEDLSAPSGTADPRGSMGIAVTDLPLAGDAGEPAGPDALPDLFVSHWVAQENALYHAVRTSAGRLEYRDRSRQTRLAEPSIERVGWGAAFADLDLDGRPDLAVANGSTLEVPGDPERLVAEPLFLFWNDGERFHDLAAASEATARARNARGLAVADYDGDGRVDLALAVNRGEPVLLRNETRAGGRSLAVRLAGPDSAVLGARIEVNEPRGRQIRWVGCDASYLSGHDRTQHFGLGSGDARVRVVWADGEESVAEVGDARELTVRHPGLSRGPAPPASPDREW